MNTRITVMVGMLMVLCPGPSHSVGANPIPVIESGQLETRVREVPPPGKRLTEQGRNVRGVYVPVTMARTRSPQDIAIMIHRIGANAVIVDVKDDHGRVVFRDDLPLAQGQPHGQHRNMAQLVSHLRQNGIYTIARLVCFKDHRLPGVRRNTAIMDSRTGQPWRDKSNRRWLDPWSSVAVDYLVSLARETESLGFEELQLDYVRFPVEPETRYAVYPNRKRDVSRSEAIAILLRQISEAISIPLSIDVFGLTAYHPNDSEFLGQRLEILAPHVDVISPMVYLANWPRSFWENPDARRTHEVISGAIARIRERLGEDVVVRPLLQGFQWRSGNWGTPFILNQIDAAITGGSTGYLFWNPRGNYDVVAQAWRQLKTDEVDSDCALRKH